DRQAVSKRGCCNESVAFGAWVGNVKLPAAQRHRHINGQDSIFKASQNVIVDPSSQDCTLRGVFALDQASAKFDFEYRDGGYEEARRRNCIGPSCHIAMSFIWPPQF